MNADEQANGQIEPPPFLRTSAFSSPTDQSTAAATVIASNEVGVNVSSRDEKADEAVIASERPQSTSDAQPNLQQPLSIADMILNGRGTKPISTADSGDGKNASFQQTPASQATARDPGAIELFSVESEKLLISAILNPERKDIVHGLIASYAPEDFHQEHHQAIWRIASQLTESGMEHGPIEVLDRARQLDIFIGGQEYIFSIADDPLLLAAADESIKQAGSRIKEYATSRRLEALMQEGLRLIRQPGQTPMGVLTIVEDDLINLRRKNDSASHGPKSLEEGLDVMLGELDQLWSGKPLEQGITSGSKDLDKKIGGLLDGCYYVFGARPSMGKTASLLDMANSGSTAGRPALIFSLESKQSQLLHRLVASEGRVTTTDIRSPLDGRNDADADKQARILEGIQKLRGKEIWIDDTPGLTIQELRSRARQFIAEHGKCTIFIDYLQKISHGANEDRRADERQHVSRISSTLQEFAREMNVPVVVLSQLSRELERRTNKRPIMSDLRESGQIEQDADVIIFLYRDSVYNPETPEPNVAEWIVAKNRDGELGTVFRYFDVQHGRFEDKSVDIPW